MDDKKLASPACALSEAPEAYRGYLEPAEIAAQLSAIAAALEAAGRKDLAERMAALRRDLPLAEPAAPAVTDTPAAFDTLLPRIADDRLHAALKAIRETL